MNYYSRIENPVMLVFVDLSVDDNPRNCFSYYLWIDDEIENLLEGKKDLSHLEKKSHTFHIPVKNKLIPKFNALPYLNDRLEKKRSLEGIYRVVEKKYDDTTKTVQQISKVLETNKIAIETVLNQTDSPWLDAPKESFAYDLKESSKYLSTNSIALAEDKLDSLKLRIKEANSHEKSEYYYQKAFFKSLIGERHAAKDYYKKAYDLSKSIKKYHIAYLDSLIEYENIDKKLINNIIREIEEKTDIDYIRLKAKLLSLSGAHDEALEVLKSADEKETFVTKAIILSLSESYKECIEYIDNYISANKISNRQRLSLKSIRARCNFHIGIPDILEDKVIPFSGLKDMKTEILKESWIDLVSAFDLAKKLEYPPDIEIIIDVFSILGMYFSEQNIVKKHLVPLAESRPAIQLLQDLVLKIALHTGDDELAEKQFKKVPSTLNSKIDEILLLSRNNRKREIVQRVIGILKDLSEERPTNYDVVVTIAAECANELFMNEELDILLNAINSFPDSEALISLYHFFIEVNQNILAKDSAVKKLFEFYKNGNKHYQILYQLFDNLSPYEKETAKMLLKVSEDIQNFRDFSEKEYIIICKSKATLEDWKDVLNIAKSCASRFSANSLFQAFQALALDELGETNQSLEMLDKIIRDESQDPIVLEIYCNIAAGCGLIEKAKNILSMLIEKATKKSQKLKLLKMMYSVEMYIDPKNPSLIKICLKYGRLCNQDDEHEEGTFLIQFFTATLDPSIGVDEGDVKDFQKRLANFSKNFPKSNILRSISVKDNNPDELIDQIHKITGLTDEKLRFYERNVNLLKREKYPIPYIIRPLLLPNINNFIQLWETSKVADKEYFQYQLSISIKQYKLRELRHLTGKIPLIEEISLVVLYDLGLLNHLFTIFQYISIPKSAINNLQYLSQEFMPNSSSIKAKEILNILVENIKRLKLPSTKIENAENQLLEQLNQYKSVYNSSSHILYTDDAILRHYICGEEHYEQTITTLDIIAILRNKSIILRKEAAQKYAILCSFNVLGALVNYIDILIVIQDDMPPNGSIDEYLSKLNNNIYFNYFINGLWWFKGDYGKALFQIGDLLSYMITEEDGVIVENNIIVAIWYVWFQKIQFLFNAESSKIAFLSRSFLSTAYKITSRINSQTTSKNLWQRIWRIYNDLVQFAYGNSMNRILENQSITTLANMIAESEYKSNKPIFSFIATGLSNGTSECELFTQTYENEIIKLRSNQGEGIKFP